MPADQPVPEQPTRANLTEACERGMLRTWIIWTLRVLLVMVPMTAAFALGWIARG